MRLNLDRVSFSRFGSYLAFRKIDESYSHGKGLVPGVHLRSHHGGGAAAIMRLELTAASGGAPLKGVIEADASLMSLRAGTARAEFCVSGQDEVRLRVRGGALRLFVAEGAYNYVVPVEKPRWLVNASSARQQLSLTPLSGELRAVSGWPVVKKGGAIILEMLPDPAKGWAEVVVEEFEKERPKRSYRGTFEEHAASAASDFEAFCEGQLDVPSKYREAARQAAYVNWSAVVGPDGHYTRPAMLMGKNWMCCVWSWDHCFNVMALAGSHPAFAWDQFMLLFDNQGPDGRLPDYVNDLLPLWAYVKPPVHGWTLRRMREASPTFFSRARLKECYALLCRWTEWWLRERGIHGDGLPTYYHVNDSGWDNGTVFDAGVPLIGADLAAFLVIQADVLAGIADELGKKGEAKRWRGVADELLTKLLARLWDGRRFKNPNAFTGKTAEKSDSVFTCLPVVLGRRLPDEIVNALAQEIRRHLTPFGPATEHPASPLYEPNGYWRGPIWAPSTFILEDGLRRAGHTKLADDIARRFCDMARKSGFAENYDALTGAPLCDPAYTWSSSVFLLLARRLA